MRNWTIQEAMKVIKEGNDTEAIKEIVSHFPMFAVAAARNDLYAVSQLMTDKFTLNRLMKSPDGAQAAGSEDAGEEAPAAKAAEPTGDLSEMSTKQLMKLCDDRGIKVPHYGKNKQFYLDALANAGEDTSGDDAGEDDANDDPYAGKSAKELYQMCKDRGIKVDIKKPADLYAKKLREADEAEAAAEDGGDDDGWGDEAETEAPAPKAAAKSNGKGKGGSKPAAKPAAKAEEDEWDI